ncbi:hypothetical protein EV175_000160 [Coemansia sp. RSA 1933]|nr:hypothetical protein EV175_000160 [Coemansia sp. RSA 1933]
METQHHGISEKAVGTDAVHKALKTSVDLAIGTGEYHHGALHELHTNITQYAVKKIGALTPQVPFKYIVTCTIVQNTDAGFHIGNSLHWDDARDVVVTYDFQNKAMHIILTAYLISPH